MTETTRQDNNIILDVQNLSVGFGKGRNAVEVVSDVSFTLHRGEILSLVGESGCGKSLSCLALTRLLPPGGNILQGKVNFYTSDGKMHDLARVSNRDGPARYSGHERRFCGNASRVEPWSNASSLKWQGWSIFC